MYCTLQQCHGRNWNRSRPVPKHLVPWLGDHSAAFQRSIRLRELCTHTFFFHPRNFYLFSTWLCTEFSLLMSFHSTINTENHRNLVGINQTLVLRDRWALPGLGCRSICNIRSNLSSFHRAWNRALYRMVYSVVTVWDSRNQLRLRENSAGSLRQTCNSPANNFRRRDHLRRIQSSPSSCPTIDLVDLRQHCHRSSNRVDSWPQKPACSVVVQNWTKNRVDTSFAPDSRWLKLAKCFFFECGEKVEQFLWVQLVWKQDKLTADEKFSTIPWTRHKSCIAGVPAYFCNWFGCCRCWVDRSRITVNLLNFFLDNQKLFILVSCAFMEFCKFLHRWAGIRVYFGRTRVLLRNIQKRSFHWCTHRSCHRRKCSGNAFHHLDPNRADDLIKIPDFFCCKFMEKWKSQFFTGRSVGTVGIVPGGVVGGATVVNTQLVFSGKSQSWRASSNLQMKGWNNKMLLLFEFRLIHMSVHKVHK